MATLLEALKSGENVQIVVGIADLKEMVLQVIEEYEQGREAQKQSVDEANDLVSIAEVCSRLNVSKPTLYRWHTCGYLRRVKVGRKVFYKESDLRSIETSNIE